MSEASGMPKPAAQLSGLSKSFGEKVAVDSVSVTMPERSFFGIVGPNGAGKTTTLRMMTGLLKPDRGSARIHGVDVWSEPVRAKQLFGFVPDNPRLFDRLTAHECLEYIGALRRMDEATVLERSRALLDAVDLAGETGTILADYSLGMTKRIALAAALLHNPRVLILDEPFGALDPVNTQVMEELLQEYRLSGGTVIFSSHVMDVVERLCDRLVVIAQGRVLATGAVAELSAGRPLQRWFVDLVGGRELNEGDVSWLGSWSD